MFVSTVIRYNFVVGHSEVLMPNIHQTDVYRCQDCNLSWVNQVLLDQHIRIFHPPVPAGHNLYSPCPTCGVLFGNQNTLRAHQMQYHHH